MSQSSIDLFRALQQADPEHTAVYNEAFAKVWARYAPWIRAAAVAALRDQHLADDVFSEFGIKLLQALRAKRVTAENRDSMMPWVVTVARNLIRNMLRKRHPNLGEAELDRLADRAAADVVERVAAAEAMAHRCEQYLGAFRTALWELREESKTEPRSVDLFLLVYRDRLTVEEACRRVEQRDGVPYRPGTDNRSVQRVTKSLVTRMGLPDCDPRTGEIPADSKDILDWVVRNHDLAPGP